MSRIGSNPNTSSDTLERRMLPDVEDARPKGGADIDLAGDGVHKIYLHQGQLDIYNWQANTTYLRAARGFGKTSYIGLHMMKCVLGMRRQMGGFVGASAKQLYTRTMPNALKVVNTLGFEQFYFLGQPPAKLRWDAPLARPRVWENCVSFANGFVWQMLSMAVRGSANGLNLAALVGDETKYLPWQRVKEEVLPTLRGDFMPPSARKTEKQIWGYGINKKQNPYYCSQLWVSDAGLTQAQCLWEQDGRDQESADVNSKIAEMLSELELLNRHNKRLANELAQNENYLRKLNALRSESSVFWNWSSLENLNMLGMNFLHNLERQLPRMMFEIQVLGRMVRNAGDGFYCQFSEELNTYESQDCTDFIIDKFSHKAKGRFLDAQRYPTNVEYMTMDLDELQAAGEDCSCDMDVQYDQPLRIAIDAGHQMNCMVVGQTSMYQGKPSVMVMKEFFVQGETRLRGLVRMFTEYYRPHLRRRRGKSDSYGGGAGEVIYYYNQTSRQGGATPYAVENSEDSRFDNVVVHELESYGWKVTRGEFSVWRHERKWQLFCDIFSFRSSPSVYISRESGRCQYLLTAITQAGVLPGFKKDKSREKLKSDDGIGGDPRTRTDITDAFDDLIIGVKEGAEGNRKVGGRLRGRFGNLTGIPR